MLTSTKNSLETTPYIISPSRSTYLSNITRSEIELRQKEAERIHIHQTLMRNRAPVTNTPLIELRLKQADDILRDLDTRLMSAGFNQNQTIFNDSAPRSTSSHFDHSTHPEILNTPYSHQPIHTDTFHDSHVRSDEDDVLQETISHDSPVRLQEQPKTSLSEEESLSSDKALISSENDEFEQIKEELRFLSERMTILEQRCQSFFQKNQP
ncbi:hypothetical protein BLNAU_14036 [Blattamonas nauphoetae]|uniref:Uncharacterized protein n=1 Tax=Blattamonas nauphoetae TaxID=2049346 RepID=A0ABQ9XIP1_9EUKA|nr:hypothetical protein BLNAU_14036 [Blattamonas nauphoetae]